MNPMDAGIYRNHLHRLLHHLQEHPQLAIAFQRVIAAQAPIELEPWIAFKLQSVGLVRLHNQFVVHRCSLYQRYFSDRFAGHDR